MGRHGPPLSQTPWPHLSRSDELLVFFLGYQTWARDPFLFQLCSLFFGDRWHVCSMIRGTSLCQNTFPWYHGTSRQCWAIFCGLDFFFFSDVALCAAFFLLPLLPSLFLDNITPPTSVFVVTPSSLGLVDPRSRTTSCMIFLWSFPSLHLLVVIVSPPRSILFPRNLISATVS